MRTETESIQNSPVGLMSLAPWRVCAVQPLECYRLHVKFMDGLEGFVDLSQFIKGESAGVFEALRDQNFFKRVFLNYGAVTWPEELDLAPDAMYDAIKDNGEWIPR
jgi:hypothetical protein